MRFVHIADIHFDSVFSNLSSNQELCKLRRLEQRECFKRTIEYVKENNIPFLFISGDLYENKYIRESTIKYIDNLFKLIPNTKVFIAPGNHDPYIKSSFYNNYNWSNNVHIFKPQIEKVEVNEVNVYGYGFNDFYCDKIKLDGITLDKSKINILVIHGTLEGSEQVDKIYNPISKKEIESIGFDYVALGHIHKRNYIDGEKNNIIYPGSLASLGFDEQGEHGLIDCELTKENINTKFVKIDTKTFEERDLDISNVYSEEEVIEHINNMYIDSSIYCKVNLVGVRNFELNINEINKLNSNTNVIKVKDKTKLDYNLEGISVETTLKGMFAKEILEEIKKDESKKDFLSEVFEIGLEILDK